MEGVEGDVVNDGIVSCVDCCGGDFWTCFLEAVEVPRRQKRRFLSKNYQ